MAEPISYNWRRSPRAKVLQVRITPWQGVEVVIPRHTSHERVRAFLTRHRNWIRDTWRRLRSEMPDPDQRLPASLVLPACGERWRVRYQRRPGAQVRVTTGKGQNVTVFHDGRDESAVRRALRRWLAARARSVLVPRVERLARLTGSEYRKIQIRGQRSRWGSCSSNRTLSLNYKLLFLEPALVRYLIIHELSHLRVLDHSTRFWNVVAQFEPHWRRLDAALGESWREVPAWVEMP
ncbi:MAG TPA: SprT family zinc-dependent metalloprotease [Gammaproteobacteria bacterium]|nr:SprT family zinc-dependent metalloprotease [Gammaproteobacteria bacterium]